LALRILKPDGTERAVLHAPTYATTVDANPPELRIALTNNKFRDGNTNAYLDCAAVSSIDGDYLCIEVGVRKNAASTTRTITFRYGDNDASYDLPEDDTSTNDYCPWVEFSGTLAPGPASGTLAVTLAALVLAATASVGIVGSASPTLGALTCNATGALAIVGQAAQMCEACVLSAAGTVTAGGPHGIGSRSVGVVVI
jgi:hypothetical protein